MNNNYHFDLLSFIIVIILTIFCSVYFLYKREEIKFSYVGSLSLILIGTILLAIGFFYMANKIPGWDTKIIFDYLLFRYSDIRDPIYTRTMGYFFVIIGIELFFIPLAMRRKHSTN